MCLTLFNYLHWKSDMANYVPGYQWDFISKYRGLSVVNVNLRIKYLKGYRLVF